MKYRSPLTLLSQSLRERKPTQKPYRRIEGQEISKSRVQLRSRNASCCGAGINSCAIFAGDDVDDDEDDNDDTCQIQFEQSRSLWCRLCHSSVKNGERQVCHAFWVVVMWDENMVSAAPRTRRFKKPWGVEGLKRPTFLYFYLGCRIIVEFKLVLWFKPWSCFLDWFRISILWYGSKKTRIL